jgi:hypothetical protein
MECRACDSHPTQSARNLVGHPLDRCVWSSLTTRHAAEAIGKPPALRYHPDHGPFAAAADSSAENLAIMRGEIPFLHVFAANTSAIKLYEKLGFVLRREVILTTLAPL